MFERCSARRFLVERLKKSVLDTVGNKKLKKKREKSRKKASLNLINQNTSKGREF